jgi:SAM-dependent methyltransferase
LPALMDRVLGPPGETASSWPAAVRAELARRRARLDASLGGDERVLDLTEWSALAAAVDAADGAPGDGRFDVVVSVAALVAVPDLPGVLRGVARLLAPTGRFLFVEPNARPGWTGVVASSTGAPLRPLRGQHLGRDVPAALRAGGFVITDMERFTMPTMLWPLRSFVDGLARPRAGLTA